MSRDHRGAGLPPGLKDRVRQQLEECSTCGGCGEIHDPDQGLTLICKRCGLFHLRRARAALQTLLADAERAIWARKGRGGPANGPDPGPLQGVGLEALYRIVRECRRGLGES